MIVGFLTLYPDELLYSLFARYYAQSGHLAYVFAAEELFENRTIKPDIEFMDRLTPEVIGLLTKEESLKEIVEQHTMFPYYARFLDLHRRRQALALLLQMDERYHNLLYQIKSKRINRYLRYCPLCAEDDRNQHGETYWHRSHQLHGVEVCPKHHCFLCNSAELISSKGSPSLVCADMLIPAKMTAVPCENALLCAIADYVHAVFQSPVDMETDIPVGKFLHSKLEYTKYLSPRGEKRNVALLFADYTAFYASLPQNPLNEQWKMQKMFSSERLSTYEVCLVAMFLGIAPQELTRMTLPSVSQPEWFDAKIRELHSQGLKYPAIARIMNAPYDVVKFIGNRKMKTSPCANHLQQDGK